VRRFVLVLAGALILAPGLVACASSGGKPAGGHPSTVSLVQADQGRHVSVTKNSTVVVRLNSTYWQFQPPTATGVLHLLGMNVHRDAGGVPGSGRGTVVARYRATSAGQAVVSATRRVCGEALACSASQRSFRVTVVVHS
jgi:hypothetical protein